MNKLLFLAFLVISCGHPSASTSKIDTAHIMDSLLQHKQEIPLKIDSAILREHDSTVAREGGGL